MKQPIKRLTALILAMAMCLSLLSVNVWAAEPEPSEASSAQSSEEATVAEEPAEEEAPAEDESEEEAPAEDESGEEAPAEDESEEEAPAEDESEEEAPAEVESEEEAPAEDESEENVEEEDPASEAPEQAKKDKDAVQVQDNGPDMKNATPLKLDETVPVQLTEEQPTATFSFTPTESDSYCFASSDNGDCDPCVYLYNVDGEEIDSADDEEGSNFKCKYKLVSGNTYYYVAKCYNNQPGSYNVKLTQIEIPTSGSCGENVTWDFDKGSGKLTIKGTGPMTSAGYNDDFQSRIKTVVIENGVTSIGESSFYDCDKLTAVTIPSSVTTIGENAFYDCGSLATVTIPASVTTIGNYAFAYCYSLETVNMPDFWPEIGNHAFYETPWWANNKPTKGKCGKAVIWTYDKDAGKLTISGKGKMTSHPYTEYYAGSIKTVVIENGVTSIGSSAFYDCSSLTSVTIPASVLAIKYLAFYECNSLTSVTIPSGVLLIGSSAFANCENLASVTIPATVARIEDSAFFNCHSLETVNLPNPWPELGSGVFSQTPWAASHPQTSGKCGENVTWSFDKGTGKLTISGTGDMTSNGFIDDYQGSIKTVEIKNGVTSISNWAFESCGSLTSVTIPASVTRIGHGAFSGCSKLTTVNMPTPWPDFHSNPFYETPWWENNKPTSGTCGENVTWSFDKGTGKLTISGKGPMTYGDFKDYYQNDIKTVTIGNGVTSIGEYAFSYCDSLTSVSIPATVTTIEAEAFSYCGSLGSVTIPASVTTIQDNAFGYCGSLETVSLPNPWPALGSYAFFETPWWGNQSAPTSGKCGANVSWSYDSDSDKLTISGTGEMTTTGYRTSYLGSIETVVIENGVTNICARAFSGCSNLTSVTIPDTVTSIGEFAFSYCDRLTTVTMPNPCPELGYDAFYQTPWWKEHIPTSGRCGKEALWSFDKDSGALTISGKGPMTSTEFINIYKSDLKTAVIGSGVTNIPENAFYNCDKLTSVTIPATVTSIGDWAFYICDNLATVTMSKPWPELGESAFARTPWWSANAPTSGTCGENVTWSFDKSSGAMTISGKGPMTSYGFKNAFQNSIKTVTIQDGVTSIGENAFTDCSNLTSATIPASVTRINDDAFFATADSLTISCYDHTAALFFALTNDIDFVSLGAAPAHEHNWINGTVTTRATCKSKGVMTYTCSGCPEKKTVPIAKDAKNHVGGTEIRGAKKATCGKEGYTGDTYCKGCGAKLSSGKKTPATGQHKWDAGKVTKQSTTTKEGVKTYTCTVCKQKKTERIKKQNTISCKDTFTKVANAAKNQTVDLKASANGAQLSYKSNDKLVTVNGGKVTIKKGFAGKATITITAKETKKYLSATKKVTVSVKPDAGVKLDKKKKVATVSWTKCTVGKGYEIQIAPKKDFKNITKTVTINKKTTASTAVKGLKAGTYYVRVRLLNGEKGSDWSAAQSFTIAK